MTTAAELRELEEEELETRLAESRRELLNLRFQLATGQLDNPARLAEVRKDVARTLTVLRDREIAEAEGRPFAPAPAPAAPPRPRRAKAAAAVEEEAEDDELADEELEDQFVAEEDLEEEVVAEDEDDDEEDQ